MRLENFLHESVTITTTDKNLFIKTMKKLMNKSTSQLRSFLQEYWNQFTEFIRSKDLENKVLQIINRNFGTHFKSLDFISNLKPSDLQLQEGFFNDLGSSLYPTLEFYPALNCWLQIDKLITGSPDFNSKILILYSIFFFLLVGGKYFSKKILKSKEQSNANI